MRNTTNVWLKATALSFFAIAAVATQALATPIACPASSIDLSSAPYNGLFKLNDDYVQNSIYDCFLVLGSGVVDLNGHTISDNASGGAAIHCSSSGAITVIDTGATKGTITGNWGKGISNCEAIDGVRITGTYSWGIANDLHPLASLKNSLVEQATVGVTGTLKNRQSVITNNNIHAWNVGVELTGMSDTSGSGTALIQGNYVRGASARGVDSDTDLVTITYNIFTERDSTDWPPPGYSDCIEAAAGAVIGGNVSDCAGPNCLYSGCYLNPADAPLWDFPVVYPTSACPGTISSGGTYTLWSDYDLAATSGSCLTVTQPNTTIDLNGYVILNSQSGGTAITCTAGGVTITDGTKLGGIRGNASLYNGHFATGIKDCATLSGVRVQGADSGVTNSSGLGLYSLSSSMIDADTTGVDSYLLGRSSTITNNWFRSAHKGIHITGVGSGTGKAVISGNAFRECHDYAVQSATQYVNVHDDLMYRRNASSSKCYDLPSGAASSHLMCDCPTECETAYPPIAYPF